MVLGADRDTVVFIVARSLKYPVRMVLAIALVLCGMGLQMSMMAALPGILLVLAGNAFLLVKGYDNRGKVGAWDPGDDWQKVEASRFDQIVELNKRILKWDRSAFDITSTVGGLLLVVVVAVAIVLGLISENSNVHSLGLVSLNLLALLVPHWVTGVRKILTTPALVNKISFIREVMGECTAMCNGLEVEHYMLLAGEGKVRMPHDVKLRVVAPAGPPELLGLYVQVSTNSVSGTDYPYLYTVLVARKGQGLKQVHASYGPPKGIITEFPPQSDVDVLVVRQYTTKTSGYHTTADTAAKIVHEGLKLLRKQAGMEMVGA